MLSTFFLFSLTFLLRCLLNFVYTLLLYASLPFPFSSLSSSFSRSPTFIYYIHLLHNHLPAVPLTLSLRLSLFLGIPRCACRVPVLRVIYRRLDLRSSSSVSGFFCFVLVVCSVASSRTRFSAASIVVCALGGSRAVCGSSCLSAFAPLLSDASRLSRLVVVLCRSVRVPCAWLVCLAFLSASLVLLCCYAMSRIVNLLLVSSSLSLAFPLSLCSSSFCRKSCPCVSPATWGALRLVTVSVARTLSLLFARALRPSVSVSGVLGFLLCFYCPALLRTMSWCSRLAAMCVVGSVCPF